jgi:KaiC/GvpD/RAD55 family RecA-like ATPase
LKHGIEFQSKGDNVLYASAKQQLELAARYYVEAGFKARSNYVVAFTRFFDALSFVSRAEAELEPPRRKELYFLAEKHFRQAAKLFEEGGFVVKKDEVLRHLERVEQGKQLLLTPSEMLSGAAMISSSVDVSALTVIRDRPIGLVESEYANVQGRIIVEPNKLNVGDSMEFSLQLINTGRKPALLIKTEQMIPEGFEIKGKPEFYEEEGGHLDMKGKRLDPLKTEEIRLVLRSFDKGTFTIRPRIIFLDETGRQMSCEPEPVTINISKVILPERITTGCEDLDNLLLGGIPKKYSVLLASPSCDERELLIRKFLEAGARKGEVTFYVTVDPSSITDIAEECQSNFYLFVCNPRADEIVKSLPNVFKLKGVENLTEISIALTSALRRLNTSAAGPRRACIETVSDALLQHHAVATRRWLTSIVPELRSRGFTTLAVMNPQMHPLEEVQAILDLFEGEISIYEKETRKGTEKFVTIKKMYNQRYLESELPLRKERLKG